MVGHVQSVCSILNCNDRILLAHYALCNHWQPTHFLDVADHFPPNAVVLVVLCVIRQCTVSTAAHQVRLFSSGLSVLRIHCQSHTFRYLEAISDVILPLAQDLGVHSESKSMEACILGSLPDINVHVILLGKIYLEDLYGGGTHTSHILDCRGGPGTQKNRSVVDLHSSLSHGNLPIRMGHLLEGGGGNADGGVDLMP